MTAALEDAYPGAAVEVLTHAGDTTVASFDGDARGSPAASVRDIGQRVFEAGEWVTQE